MPWPCRLIEEPKTPEAWAAVRPGDMWLQKDRDRQDPQLSESYRRHRAALRPPAVVCLPGNVRFCVDADYGVGGWDVRGEPPRLTVSPSIDAQGIYHGFLRGGILTDDVDGRKYP